MLEPEPLQLRLLLLPQLKTRSGSSSTLDLPSFVGGAYLSGSVSQGSRKHVIVDEKTDSVSRIRTQRCQALGTAVTSPALGALKGESQVVVPCLTSTAAVVTHHA